MSMDADTLAVNIIVEYLSKPKYTNSVEYVRKNFDTLYEYACTFDGLLDRMYARWEDRLQIEVPEDYNPFEYVDVWERAWDLVDAEWLKKHYDVVIHGGRYV